MVIGLQEIGKKLLNIGLILILFKHVKNKNAEKFICIDIFSQRSSHFFNC